MNDYYIICEGVIVETTFGGIAEATDVAQTWADEQEKINGLLGCIVGATEKRRPPPVIDNGVPIGYT